MQKEPLPQKPGWKLDARSEDEESYTKKLKGDWELSLHHAMEDGWWGWLRHHRDGDETVVIETKPYSTPEKAEEALLKQVWAMAELLLEETSKK